MQDAFFCRCYENDVHFCRASRAAQCHILRRRAQDGRFKSLQKEYLADQTPYPKKFNSNKQDKQSASNPNKNFVIWYRVDQQPKAIVKVCDDVDEANDCVKSAFVDYNPWDMSSLELRCLDTFQSTYSATGLAHYSVSLSTKTNNKQSSSMVVSPVDIAKETSSLDAETETSPSPSVSNSHPDQPSHKDDPVLLAKGNHWEVCAHALDDFLQDYGCDVAPALLSVTPSTHQPVEWYSFPEHDPFDPELPTSEKVHLMPTSGNKRNSKKKTVSEAVTSSTSPQILYGYQNDLKKAASISKKHVSYADTPEGKQVVPLPTKNTGGKRKTTKDSSSTSSSSSLAKKGPVPPRIVPALGITEDDFDYDAALPSLTGRKRGRKTRLTKEGKDEGKEEESEEKEDVVVMEVTPSKTKRARAPKEAGAPKGPVSSFMFYTIEQRPQVRSEFPHLSVTEVTRRMGESWRKLTATEKEPFEKRARQERERYNKEMTDFKASKQEKETINEHQETNEKHLNELDESLLQLQSQIIPASAVAVVQETETAAEEESISDDEEEDDDIDNNDIDEDNDDYNDEEEEMDEEDELEKDSFVLSEVDKVEKNVVQQGQLHDTSTLTETQEEDGDSSASDILDSSQEETDLEMMMVEAEQPEMKRPRLE